MYIPPQFSENSPDEIRRLIETHPLAALVYSSAEGVDAQHIPLIFDGEKRLIGHVAANNELLRDIDSGDRVLAIFSGQGGYISPNWYPSKAQHHQHVPTWNYQVVHVHGQIQFLTDEKAKRAVVGKLTKRFETLTNGKAGWKMSDAPADYLNTMLAKIVAFELVIERIAAKSKLSQNRDRNDYDSVISKMELNGSDELAARMKRFK